MSATEIILIVIGVAVFLLGYLMPARRKDLDEEVQLISEDEVRKMVAGEVGQVKDKIADIVDETVNYSIEKAERAMERVTNEKIMAVNEYSDTVLEEINKNHKEVVFLYDMLNDKHDNLMTAINEATATADEIRQTAKDVELLANDAADKVDAVMQAADEAAEMIQDSEDAAVKARKAAQETMQTVIKVVQNTKDELKALHEAYPGNKEAVQETVNAPQAHKEPEEQKIAETQGMPEAQAVPEMPETQGIQEPVESEGVPEDSGWVDVSTVPNLAEFIGEDEAGTEPEDGILQEPEKDTPEEVTDYDGPDEETGGEAVDEPVDFKPIAPRKVEIIHQPDGDYVADDQEDMSTSAAFASMGFFTPKSEEEEPKKRARTRKGARKDRLQENAASVDIQFAQGKDNGRNSNERILELHKAGKSNMAIARELGLGLGEVKLVIDLFEGM